MMEANKEIKVYGTLKNHTVSDNTAMRDNTHSDLLAFASQLYDDRFIDNNDSVEKYQDNINKRVTKVKYDPETGMTIIEGDTTIEGDLYVDNIYIKHGDTYVSVDLLDILERLEKLESLWYLNSTTNRVTSRMPAEAAGFYDSTIN